MADDESIDQQQTVQSPKRQSTHLSHAVVDSIPAFGHYVSLQFLGQGGHARVYKAWDPALGRFVALKFLRLDDPEWRLRQMREAQAQARVKHPHVCQVYEVSEVEGRQYIAMQYIDGQPLAIAVKEMTLEQKIRLMHQVALALQEAHRTGLIHRDIKPANIIVERDSIGDYVPHVMDFGLARELDSPGLTTTGTVLGTPSYMSPEQARGSAQIDRRTDIYSLGATLYEILTNEPPHDGDSSLQVLHRVIHEEPMPPRKKNPAVPRELETITMKCLDKDPDRRYESARALADDLERYLSGDPVMARSAGLTYRIYRRMKKHPAVSALLGAAGLLVIASAGYATYTSWRSTQQARLLQEFAQQTQEMDGLMRYSYLLPLHDVRPQEKIVRARLDRLEKRMNQLGTVAFGPGNYALGRGWMSLHEYEQAKKYLELSWNGYGYQLPQVAYGLGLTYTMLYQKELKDASHIRSASERLERLKSIDKEFRQPALHYIKIGKSDTDSSELITALIQFLEQRYSSAISTTDKVLKKMPWLYEAGRLQGDSITAIANDLRGKGDYENAIVNFQKAGIAYKSAILSGRSDAETYRSLCNMQQNLLELQIYQTGASPTSAFNEGIQACEDALKADPDDAETYATLLSIYTVIAYYQVWTSGEDARPVLDKAFNAGENSLRLHPDSADYLRKLGRALTLRAEYDMYHGADPRPWLEKANQNLSKATKIDPGFASAYSNLGVSEYYLALHQMENGLNPLKTLEVSIENYNKALKISPDSASYNRDLGAAYILKAEYELYHGIDVRPSVNGTIESQKRAIALNPKEQIAHFNLAQAYVFEASYFQMHGIDPSEALKLAEQSLKKALEINPDDDYSYIVLSSAALIRAQYAVDAGQNPDSAFQSAESNLQKAISIAPDRAIAFWNLGMVYVVQANSQIDNGKNPGTVIAKARIVLEKAKAFHPVELPDVLMCLGQTELAAARWNLIQGHSSEPFARNAMDYLDQAIRANAQLAEAYLSQAKLQYLLAQETRKHGRSDEKEIISGLSYVDHALTLNANYAEAYEVRGKFLFLRKDAKESESAMSQAFKLNPLLKRKYEGHNMLMNSFK